MNPPSTRELLLELRRELHMRESVYPSWVRDRKLSQVVANHRIACIRELIFRIDVKEQTTLPLGEPDDDRG